MFQQLCATACQPVPAMRIAHVTVNAAGRRSSVSTPVNSRRALRRLLHSAAKEGPIAARMEAGTSAGRMGDGRFAERARCVTAGEEKEETETITHPCHA